MTEGPLLWYLNRGSGLALLPLLTLAVLLGALATRGEPRRGVPRFALQSLHRNVALLSVMMLALHVATAVADEYVDIRWWHAVVPWGLRYEPWWLAAGVVALDLVLAAVVTSLVRTRMPRRGWLVVHLGVYAALAASFAHGLGIGTDTGAVWARWVYVGSAAVVLLAVGLRVGGLVRRPVVAAMAPAVWR